MVWDRPTDAATNASTSSLTLPKKGILKRSCSHSGFGNEFIDKPNRLISLRLFRPSTDRFVDKKASRIPKLSLTWSEKNAVAIFGDTTSEETLDEPDEKPCTSKISEPLVESVQSPGFESLRQTNILSDDDEPEDSFSQLVSRKEDENIDDLPDVDCQSVTSTGSSHISGKWWFGKSTRFVTHCAKRGCTNHNEPEVYMTPTQRYIAQIRSLKKQLKTALDQLEEKEAHLGRLKVRIGELERLIDASFAAREEQRHLHAEEKRLTEELEDNKEQHNALKRTSAESPSQTVKLFLELEESKNRRKNSEEKETMTDVAFGIERPIFQPSLPTSVQPEILQSLTFPVQHELLLQLQAYQNEIVVWRTKAAHLQALLKDHVLQPKPRDLMTTSEVIEKSEKKLNERWPIDDSNIGLHYASLPDKPSISARNVDSNASSSSTDIKEEFKHERLRRELEEKNRQLDGVDEQLKNMRTEMAQLQKEHKESIEALQNIKNDFEQSAAELQAANMTIIRLQKEVSTKTKAMDYLEERSQAYRNIILDNDLTVPDESTENWRRGFSDPRFIANPSKKVQTQLTSEDLHNRETHLHDLKDRFRVLEEELSTNEQNLKGKVREAEENLSAKNYLVELLTVELEKKEKEIKELSEKHRLEKQELQTKINELTKSAERVPVLEIELEKLQQDKSLMHLRLQDAKDEFDAGLENSLSETLKKYQQQSSYWTEKMSAANEANQNLRAKIAVLERELEQLRLRMKVEKADMSQRLTSSIRKVDDLRSQINRSTRDVEIEAHPNYTSKYVTCKPNTRQKSTDIKKGDFFDEMEERLKLCQGELSATRRQVEVLQQKLVDTVQTQVEDQKSALPLQAMIRNAQKKDKATEVNVSFEFSKEIETLKEKVDQLEEKNYELTSALSKVEEEKWDLVMTKREQITQLAAEFESVRKEFDQEISKYESERSRLKSRIKILTKAKLEKDWLIQRLQKNDAKVVEKHDFTPVTRCVSVPHLRKNSIADELQTTRACNSILMQVNANLNKELMIVRRLIETSMKNDVFQVNENTNPTNVNTSFDPEFKGLACDLNQVRKDLENIVFQIDKFAGPQDSMKLSDSENTVTLSEEEKREMRMENDLDRLRKALKRSWADREILSKQLDRITAEFREISNKPDQKKNFLQRSYVYDERPPIMRSRSFAGLAKWWNNRNPDRQSDMKNGQFETFDNGQIISPSYLYKDAGFVEERSLPFESTNRLTRAASLHFPIRPALMSTKIQSGTENSKYWSLPNLLKFSKNISYDLKADLCQNRILRISQTFAKQSGGDQNSAVSGLNEKDGRKSVLAKKSADTEDLEFLKRANENLKNENIRLNNLKNVRINDLKTKISALLEQNETLGKRLDEIEKERQEMYLIMFKKGRQAAEHDIEELHAFNELTEHHVVLRFLHDAFYYYLLNKGDAREHLQVIMAMLNFTEQQREDVLRRRGTSH